MKRGETGKERRGFRARCWGKTAKMVVGRGASGQVKGVLSTVARRYTSAVTRKATQGRPIVPRARPDKAAVLTRRLTTVALTVCAFNVLCANGVNAEDTCMDLKTSSTTLQYCDIVVGTGAEPVKGSKIKCHYIGKLTNGVKFDASYDRGKPLEFNVGAGMVIKGWDIGILGADDIPPMKVGGKRRLLIPSSLGYGERGAGGVIPGGATLDFEVELVSV